MAFYEEEKDKELDPNAPQETTTGPQSGIISGQGVPTGKGGGAVSATGGATPGSPSGTFAGIQDYIKANEAQSGKLAGQVGGYIEEQGKAAQDSLAKAQADYEAKVKENTVGLNKDLIDQAASAAETVAADKAKAEEFARMRDAEYKGPANLEETEFFNPVAEQISKARESAKFSQDEAGQRQLLEQMRGDSGRKISRGAISFDTALLQADPQAKSRLEEARKSVDPLEEQLKQASAKSVQDAIAAKQATEATREAIQSRFGGENSVQKGLERSLLERAASAQNQSKQQAEATINALKNNAQLDDQQLKLLGVSKEDWNKMTADRDQFRSRTGNTNLNDFSGLTQIVNPQERITAQNIANAEDYARYQALNQLMGVNNTFLSDPSQAGKANFDVLDFNFSGARGNVDQAIAAQKQADAQRAAEADSAKRRQEETQRRETQNTAVGATAGFIVAGPIGAVIGGLIGHSTCHLHNTPILMANSHYKKVQDLEIGDQVMYGGTVQAHGKALCSQLVEYKGQFTSPTHAVFDGQVWVRAKDLKDGKIINLDITTLVYPVIVEKHILISDNGVVYADMVEVDLPGVSDADKLLELNKLQCVDTVKKIEREIKWKYNHLKLNTIAN